MVRLRFVLGALVTEMLLGTKNKLLECGMSSEVVRRNACINDRKLGP